jgi:FecR protein
MFKLLKTSVALSAGVFLAAMLAPAQTQGRIGQIGTINYIEGQASLNGQPVSANQVGQLVAAPGQVISTADGKAEMLLTPGVFLRLDANSAVKMISPSLTRTTVELLQGKAMVEADQVEKENHIAVVDHGANTWIEKHGVYEFNAANPMVAVYDGKAQVREDDRTRDVGKGEEVALTQNPKLKTRDFNRKTEDDLYAWSKLRSEYVSEANMASAQTIVMGNPGWWYGTGWYWNPWFDSWAFVPGDGFLYSPFGFGFYSPAFWGAYAPFYYRPGFGFYGRPGFGYAARGPVAAGRVGAVAPAFRGGALGGFRGSAMGGFRGGFGGFHGGVGGRR